MTKPLNSNIPLIILDPTPHFHNNGPSRKRKILIRTNQGLISARRAYYQIYHPTWDGKGKVIHLDNNDLNFHPDNLVLLTERECNNLVHFNNNLLINNNPELQSQCIMSVQASIALKDLLKDINDDDITKGGDNNEN